MSNAELELFENTIRAILSCGMAIMLSAGVLAIFVGMMIGFWILFKNK